MTAYWNLLQMIANRSPDSSSTEIVRGKISDARNMINASLVAV